MGELWLNGISYSGGGGADVEITGEASGAVASFEDGSANPLKSLVVDINPIQAGSGTPAPDNVRPISGWSSVEVTVADDTTDPTTEETYEITLGQTVYGGKLNVTTGELTIDRALVEYDGSSDETWAYVSSYGGFRVTIADANINGIPSAQVKSNRFVGSDSRGATDKDITGKMLAYTSPSDNIFLFFTTQITDLSEWQAWLSENITQVEYPLATPTTYQLTPTEVDSLLDNNNIWADSGDVDVVYIRDIDKAFNILWNAVMNSNSGTRSLNLMKGAISETKEDIEEPIKEEEETKEGKDENQR